MGKSTSMPMTAMMTTMSSKSMTGEKKVILSAIVVRRIRVMHMLPRRVKEILFVNKKMRPTKPATDVIPATSTETRASFARIGNPNASELTKVEIPRLEAEGELERIAEFQFEIILVARPKSASNETTLFWTEKLAQTLQKFNTRSPYES